MFIVKSAPVISQETDIVLSKAPRRTSLYMPTPLTNAFHGNGAISTRSFFTPPGTTPPGFIRKTGHRMDRRKEWVGRRR